MSVLLTFNFHSVPKRKNMGFKLQSRPGSGPPKGKSASDKNILTLAWVDDFPHGPLRNLPDCLLGY